jgi:ribosomal protein S18 acetylase RimI-like enzyme
MKIPGKSPEQVKVIRLRSEDFELARVALRKLKTPKRIASPVADYLRTFLARPENVLFVAVVVGKPVGFLLAYILDRLDGDARMVLFYEIGVAASHRRRGIGGAMVEALKALCSQENAIKMWVQTNRSNLPAVRLYESAGGVTQPSGDEVTYRFDPECFDGGR